MSKVFFETPSTLNGTAQEQLQTLYSYLYQMSEKLNEAMQTITIENMEPDLQVQIRTVTGTEGQQLREKESNALKSMIVKTANIVRSEMDEIRTTLESSYEALSEDFGSYERNLTNNITATAEGILQNYRFEERIQGNTDTMDAFIRKTNQYIFSGLIDTVEVGGVTQERYGIAIGNNVTATDANGNESLDRENMMATFTMDELAFYVGSVKVAWFSNATFFIDRGRIVSSLQIGNHVWKAMSDGSMVLVTV